VPPTTTPIQLRCDLRAFGRHHELSRQIVERGIYPAVDPLASFRAFSIHALSAPSITPWPRVKSILQRYKDCRTLLPFSVSKNFRRRQAHCGARAQNRKFLSQPMFVAAQFTGLEGKYVKIEDTVRSFKEIVEGKYDDVPEQAFTCRTIEEALKKARP